MSDTYVSAHLRREVRDRAKERCEYCLIPEWACFAAHEVDHVIAEKHGGPTNSDNLSLSCVVCNKSKGSDIASLDPDTGSLERLFHPRRDDWREHFRLNDGRIEPLTSIGRVTVRLLRFNLPDRIEERQLLLASGWDLLAGKRE
jgi:hypothetical protein